MHYCILGIFTIHTKYFLLHTDEIIQWGCLMASKSWRETAAVWKCEMECLSKKLSRWKKYFLVNVFKVFHLIYCVVVRYIFLCFVLGLFWQKIKMMEGINRLSELAKLFDKPTVMRKCNNIRTLYFFNQGKLKGTTAKVSCINHQWCVQTCVLNKTKNNYLGWIAGKFIELYKL